MKTRDSGNDSSPENLTTHSSGEEPERSGQCHGHGIPADEIAQEMTGLADARAVEKVGSWETDLGTMRVVWSAEIHRIFGTDPDSFAPTHGSFLEMVHPADRDMVDRAFLESFGLPETRAMEHRIISKGGDLKVVKEIWSVIGDMHGHPVRAIGTIFDITERKKTEDGRERLFNLSPDLLTIANFDGFLEQANPAWSACLGWNAGELTKRRWLELVHPDDRRITAEATHALYSGEPLHNFESRFLCREGGYKWLSWNAYPLMATRQVFGAGRDVTERKKMENQADRMEIRLAKTLESITDVVFTLDSEWRFTFLNSEAERLLQRGRGELLGGNIWELYPEAVGGTFQKEYERALNGQVTVDFEQYYDFLEKWFEVRAYPVTGGLMVYLRDVTARRHTEAQLRLLESCVSKLNDFVLITEADPIDEHGPHIIFVNDAFVNRTGYTRDEVLGKSPRFLQGPKTQRDSLDRIRGALARHEPIREEMINYTKHGEEMHLEIDIVPIFETDGECRYFVAIEREVTERKNLERQFLRAQRMDSIGTLASGLAHDLNNVLAPIVLSVDLLRDMITDPEGQEILDLVASSIQRGTDMVSQVLTFARGVDPKLTVVDVVEVLGNLERIVVDSFPKNIRIKVRTDAELWSVRGDATQIHQVLLNLCVNSRDAMPEGGEIIIKASNTLIGENNPDKGIDINPGKYLLIEVIDSGQGIDKNIIDDLFDPFFTTKDIGKGTGLGLSTSLSIVKSHGGVIQVHSEQKNGACFRVYLPAVTERPEGCRENTCESIPRSNGETILLVDDEEAILNVARKSLENFGYRVLTAGSGVEAITVYVRNRSCIAVVLTDMMMPEMDGLTVAKALLSLNPNVKIIASSGISSGDNVLMAITAGVRNFLPKPYKSEALLRMVAELIRE